MGKKLIFIFNPKAGKGKIKSSLTDIIDIFNKGGYEVIIRATQCTRDAYEQAKLYADQVDLVVCSGGDGTLDEVVTGLMERNSSVPIGYIPAGSTNDFANSLHISKNMLQAATDVVEGTPHVFDVGWFNKDYFVYIAAFGLFTDVSYETNQDMKNILGHAAYILEGTQRLFNIKSYHLQIECDEEAFEGEFIFGMISNTTSVGGFKGLTGPDVMLDDGVFEVMLIKRPKNILELNEIIASLVGTSETKMIQTFKTSSLSIKCEEDISWTLDGEFGGQHRNVEIKNLKNIVEIMLHKNEEIPLINSPE